MIFASFIDFRHPLPLRRPEKARKAANGIKQQDRSCCSMPSAALCRISWRALSLGHPRRSSHHSVSVPMLRLQSFSGGQLPEGSNHRRMAIQLYVAGYGVSVTASAPVHCIQYSIGGRLLSRIFGEFYHEISLKNLLDIYYIYMLTKRGKE